MAAAGILAAAFTFICMATTPGFELTAKQVEANRMLAGEAKHVLLRGGSRSGKTFVICRAILIRAMKAPGSTHTIVRKHFNHLKFSIIYDTMPAVRRLCFPDVRLTLNKSDWFHELSNGSKIIYGGLDDAERTEKILGQEHATIFPNECSQISYGARNKLVTRLAQTANVEATRYDENDKPILISPGNRLLKLRAYYDCNPPGKGHWTYGLWFKGIEPQSRKPLLDGDEYATMRLNPKDNMRNLPPDYVRQLEALPEKDRKRFLEGEYLTELDGALWNIETIQRVEAPTTPRQVDLLRKKLKRIVISIDPSGASGPEAKKNDEIGITVSGIDHKGNGYVVEDETGLMGPERWGARSVALFDKWQADLIVGEINFGGDMVRAVVHGARKNVPFKSVTASRGKHVRAEPVAALYEPRRAEKGLPIVFHAGSLVDLEDELSNFTTAGYEGERSPNRADSAIFGLTELMLDPNKKSAGTW